jgi:Derlin-2/3
MPPAARVHNVGDAAGPDQWFKALPIVTQYWFGATMVITLGGNFGIVSPMQLMFSWPAIKNNFELWRILTPFCYAGAFSFNTLITCFMLVSMSKQYEKGGPYNTGAGGGTADYVFAMMFAAVTILITYPLVMWYTVMSPIFCKNMVFFVLYVWSKRHPTSQASIWGVPVPAMYLPFAYLALTVFMGNPYMDLIHGCAVGHLYYFLAEVVPRLHGKDILVTPQFLIDQLGVGEYQPEAAARNPEDNPRGWGGPAGAQQQQQPAAVNRGGYNWGGGGRPLGRDD